MLTYILANCFKRCLLWQNNMYEDCRTDISCSVNIFRADNGHDGRNLDAACSIELSAVAVKSVLSDVLSIELNTYYPLMVIDCCRI